MNHLRFICILLVTGFAFAASGQKVAPIDTAAYGNLMIFSDPVEARVEIPAILVNFSKTDKAVFIRYIPPAKYLVRVTVKKKMLEYEAEVKPYIESHLFFDLKKKAVTLQKEVKIIPEPVNPASDTLGDIFTVVEEQPVYPGNDEARIRFLQENIRYPETAVKNGIQGRVFVSFVVEKDGSLSNIRVLRGIGGGCDEEAIRVVSLMPKWTPGRQRGEPVRVRFNVPIKFSLVNMAR